MPIVAYLFVSIVQKHIMSFLHRKKSCWPISHLDRNPSIDTSRFQQASSPVILINAVFYHATTLLLPISWHPTVYVLSCASFCTMPNNIMYFAFVFEGASNNGQTIVISRSHTPQDMHWPHVKGIDQIYNVSIIYPKERIFRSDANLYRYVFCTSKKNSRKPPHIHL